MIDFYNRQILEYANQRVQNKGIVESPNLIKIDRTEQPDPNYIKL